MAGNAQRAGPPFSNDEKNFLLAEIIKSASIQPYHLLNVVISNNIQPRWEEMPLPPGRSVNACRFALEDLKRSAGYSPQTPLSAPLSGVLKRPWQAEQPPPAGPREIRPKTDLGPGMQPMPQAGRPQDPGTTKRKRGRPTKIEAEAKARLAAAATGGASESSFGPRLPLQSGLQPIAPAMVASPAIGPRASLPPHPRMPISTMITPTAQKTTSNSSSSSGKRRRGRSLRLEQSEPSVPLGAAIPASQYQPPQYESPYGMLHAEETPARIPAMRHHDEASTASAPVSASSAQFGHLEREHEAATDSGREPPAGYYQSHRPDSRPP